MSAASWMEYANRSAGDVVVFVCSSFFGIVSIRHYWLRGFQWERNHFLDLPAPINFSKEFRRSDAQRHSQVIQLQQINPQGTVLDFGDSAARGIIPASQLQLAGKSILRPLLLVAFSAHQPPYEIALLHVPTGHLASPRRFMVRE
ncbi:MAG TPA: hypothetical protein VMA35_02725 [Candidatus Sulfopaludibacter sp.]|nr:hypothetical protein [Candidatus Sulfopaludibacter sp.]